MSLNRKTRFEYDILGRPTSEKVVDSLTNSLLSKLNLRYDDSKNRLAGYDVMVGSTTNSTDYVYGGTGIAPDLITGVNRNGIRKISYIYDGLNRLSVRNLNNFFTEYTYLQGATNTSTTTLVSSMKNGNDTLSYTYDELGNITSISKNGTVIESYTYDDLNQLKTVTRGTDTYTYNYDNGGNILSVTKNGTTIKSYTYGDTEWKDLLTAYNGQTITYDNIGNPLTYYNGSTFTWSDGRKLTGVTKGTDNISYTYDSNGLRTTKTVNGTVTEYYWLDGTLYAEKTGNQYIYFHYDDNGIAYGFTVVNGTTTADYYYIHNLQGDVIGILDSTGTKVVEYTYDEWGKILATTGTLATTIGELNPFRYRGYYYDAETEFYYCRARYYDPEICRWISADGQLAGVGGEILGSNVFTYCFNNPINLGDSTGTWPNWVKKVAKKIAKKVKSVVDTVQETLSKVNLTYSSGVNLSLTPSFWIFNGQIGVSADTKGNVSLQVSLGGGVTGGSPSASLTGYTSFTNAPRIDKLEGPYYQVGGSAATPTLIAGGGDFMILPDLELNTEYYGITLNCGVGSPGAEIHIEWGETFTLDFFNFNIFDEIEKAYIKIMED